MNIFYLSGFQSWLQDIKDTFTLNFITDDRYMYFVKGLGVTLEVTFFACLLGIFLGALVAVIRTTHDKTINDITKPIARFGLKFLNFISKIYLTVIRGTPVVVQLMICYFVIFASSKNKVLIAVLAFGFNSGAYVAEIVRAGIMSIDNGQFEAGRSLGFNYFQTMCYIVFPQAFKNILPSLANEFIVLLKETSVAGYVGLQDLTKGGDIVRGRTFSAFMPLLAVAIIYLIVVMFFTRLVTLLERRLKNSER
ncbi:MAG: amino acid ABC transporter permease [Clostridia bacterium]|nr:amino acid ABC transporter permease [Clostridia bacterium]